MQYIQYIELCSASWLQAGLQDKFELAELVMWYKSMWLESRKKSEKVRKAYEIGYCVFFF